MVTMNTWSSQLVLASVKNKYQRQQQTIYNLFRMLLHKQPHLVLILSPCQSSSSPILKMRKMRLRDGMWWGQDNTNINGQNQDMHLDSNSSSRFFLPSPRGKVQRYSPYSLKLWDSNSLNDWKLEPVYILFWFQRTHAEESDISIKVKEIPVKAGEVRGLFQRRGKWKAWQGNRKEEGVGLKYILSNEWGGKTVSCLCYLNWSEGIQYSGNVQSFILSFISISKVPCMCQELGYRKDHNTPKTWFLP